MKIQKYLKRAKVPEELWEEAQKSIDLAEQRKKGLLWFKLKVRLFKARTISEILPWDAERLVFLRPDLADNDIAPVVNITAHGDNPPWKMTPEGGRPVEGAWLNKDSNSAEYKDAVASNYWCKGEHPRSVKSRKAWYRRNAGEYLAWRLGVAVDAPYTLYEGTQGRLSVKIYHSGDAWLVKVDRKLVGNFGIKTRRGFEIDNLFTPSGEQAWYPIAGHELRAPATWSVLPAWLD